MDRARRVHLAAVRDVPDVDPLVRAAATRRLVTAHHALAGATARIVVEAAAPTGRELEELTTATNGLRERIASNEQQIMRLERRLGTQPGWSPPLLSFDDEVGDVALVHSLPPEDEP